MDHDEEYIRVRKDEYEELKRFKEAVKNDDKLMKKVFDILREHKVELIGLGGFEESFIGIFKDGIKIGEVQEFVERLGE